MLRRTPSHDLGQNLIWGVFIAASVGMIEVIVQVTYMSYLYGEKFEYEKDIKPGLIWIFFGW